MSQAPTQMPTDAENTKRECSRRPSVVAVCVSGGGIPKRPLAFVNLTAAGIEGDGHAHAKHVRPDRAISIFDLEILRDLVEEGFPLSPGAAGENLCAENLRVQDLEPGTLLQIGDVLLRLEEPRKPCYVLDAIHPQLKMAMLGRCGYMASVLRGGTIEPGMTIRPIRMEEQLGSSVRRAL